MDKQEWIKRCSKRFMERAGMTSIEADGYAQTMHAEWSEDFADDPEGAADEEMSCWDDDGDGPVD